MPDNRPQYIDIEEFRRSKGAKTGALQKFVDGEHRVSKPGELAEVVMSTATVDRGNDTINQSGWTLERFRQNPVLMWCHDYSQPPVGTVSAVVLDGGALLGRGLIFTPPEVYAFGASVGAMYTHEKRFLRGFSVGLMPGRWAFNEQRGGVDFLEQDLLELSACPIGMNPDALSAAKSARIDVAPWMLLAAKSLDGDREAPRWMTRDFATMVHGTLKAPSVQVPADFDPVAFTREVTEKAVAAVRADLATISAELLALKASLTPAPSKPDPAAIAAAVARSLSNNAAKIRGTSEES